MITWGNDEYKFKWSDRDGSYFMKWDTDGNPIFRFYKKQKIHRKPKTGSSSSSQQSQQQDPQNQTQTPEQEPQPEQDQEFPSENGSGEGSSDDYTDYSNFGF